MKNLPTASGSIGIVAIVFGLAGMGVAEAKHTNVVVIMADDIGYECYSCNGSQFYKTPNIDQLAAGGARFTHAYSQPICTPSRVKIMTGKHNFRNYVKFGLMDLTQKTFAHAVKEAGYKTCIAGKWQLSPDNLQGPQTAGFDEYCLWHFQGPQMGKKGSRYKSPLLFQNGKKIEDTQDKYGPDYAANFICDFISRNKNNPFVAYYPMILVHDPFDPTPDSTDWNEKQSKRSKVERFADMVAYMDKKIGQIVATLEAEGLRENTLIMVTGDNGTHKSIVSPWPARQEIRGAKGEMIDDGTHVAFVANWPGTIQPGTVVASPIDFADVFPTITEATGAATPTGLDGHSMLPLMKGDENGAPDWVFVDYSRNGTVPYRHFIRTQRHKLYSDGKFYDVPSDWLEKTPLASPETDAVRQHLQTKLDEILEDHPTDEQINQRRAEKGSANSKASKRRQRKNR